MYPLGFMFAEKVLLMATGFKNWRNEWNTAKGRQERKNRCVLGWISATFTTTINVIDFIMVFVGFCESWGVFNGLSIGPKLSANAAKNRSLYQFKIITIIQAVDAVVDSMLLGNFCCHTIAEQEDHHNED